MLVSYRWLRELCPGLDAAPAEVAERLSRAGLAVDGVSTPGAGLEPVTVAAVGLVEPHPTRDRLRLVTVDVGSGRAQKVVCGAPNVPGPGGLVVLAPLGTRLSAAGLTVEPRAIGGVESSGMLCSEAELGLTEESDGILILAPGTAKPGDPFTNVVPQASDTIFDIAVTPNRPDALGHVGVARDVAALYGLSLRLPEVPEPARSSDLELDQLVSVRVEEPERCPLYGASVVDDVRIAESPAWIRYRLHALGVRPISNVVDITNLLLLEFGQPMHAFDYDLVSGGKIVVRTAKAGEPFTTLDGVDRKLDSDDLVICDASGPSALAGVMGGKTSEIRETTRRVLLECAYFSPRGVRRTSRRHGLTSESSYRFERGVDWGALPVVMERAKALLSDIAGGAAVKGSIFVRGAPLERPKIRLRSKRLDAMLGVPVPFDEAGTILGRLGFSTKRVDQGEPLLDVEGASHRPDVTREIDLVEEVARIRGFDEIPTTLPAIFAQEPRTTGLLERGAAREAQNLGLAEAVTFSFVAPKELEALRAPAPTIVIRNPLSEDRTVMRTSLLPGLLETVRRARRRGEPEVRLFTVGARFLPPAGAVTTPARPLSVDDRGVLPEERPSFAAVLAGPRAAYLSKPEPVDVFDAKGHAVELVERLTGRSPETMAMSPSDERGVLAHLHPRGAAWIVVGGVVLGSLGPLHPDVIDALDLGGPAQVIEIDLAAVEMLGKPTPKFRPIPRLPAVLRDIALVVDAAVSSANLEKEIREAAGDLCEKVELFDVFVGGAIPAGRRSLAFRVVYRDPKAATDPDSARTLTDQEVEERHERVRAALRRYGELRI
jgi:phenylalanyl-tRNA synthetase beta chain